MALKIKPNRIKVDFGSYRHYWRGIKKIGKTTLFRDILLAHYGDLKYGLLISCGNETGYKALDGLYAIEAPVWTTKYMKKDEIPKNEDGEPIMGFAELVDELCKNRFEYDFKVIALDTVDELISMAIQEVKRVHKEKTGKACKSINDALGGFGAGREYIYNIVNTALTRLESCGYGLVFIGHTKLRDIKEKGEVEGYQQLTSNLEHGYDSLFADKADIIATIYTEKIIKDGVLQGKQRYIYFRDDGFIDCGSRLAGMPDRVPFSAEEYLEAFRIGVESSMTNKANLDKIDEMAKEEVEKRNVLAKMNVERENATNPEDDLKTVISELITEIKSRGGSGNSELMKVVKTVEPSGNVQRIKDIEVAKELLVKIKEMEIEY